MLSTTPVAYMAGCHWMFQKGRLAKTTYMASSAVGELHPEPFYSTGGSGTYGAIGLDKNIPARVPAMISPYGSNSIRNSMRKLRRCGPMGGMW